VAEELSATGVDMLDAPISGGDEGAAAGTLSIMTGGDETVLEAHRDVFKMLGETVTHCGPSGAGQTTKACNQIVVASQLVGVAEAIVFANKAGADLETVLDAISGGAASCWVLENRAENMIHGDFEPGFFPAYQHTDLRIATDASEAFGAPMLQTGVARKLFKLFETMVSNDKGRDDNSGIVQVIEKLAGEEARVRE
jgi:3-hydroxyisobutyrate dehydrogenase-like beta-hydroxyacid dehydrogenase